MEKELKKVIIMSISGLTLLSASMPSAVDMVQASNVNVVQEPDSKAFDVRNETVQVDIIEKTKTNFELSDKDQKIADAITDFYALDEEGEIKFNATVRLIPRVSLSRTVSLP
jgi:hypothetical protein